MNKHMQNLLNKMYYDCLDNEEVEFFTNYITNLEKEKNKYKNRCYNALKLIRDNYGLLDKYEIDILDDLLGGDIDEKNF